MKTQVNFPDKHVTFNAAKTSTNLYCSMSNVTFCGYSIDISTFHIQSNFSSYENTNIAHSLDLSKTQKPGRYENCYEKTLVLSSTCIKLHVSMYGFRLILLRMRIVLKMQPVLLDTRINSKLVAVTNIYQASLLLAFRFYAYVNCYIPAGKLNQTFFLQCIKKGLRVIRNRVTKTCTGKQIVFFKYWLFLNSLPF